MSCGERSDRLERLLHRSPLRDTFSGPRSSRPAAPHLVNGVLPLLRGVADCVELEVVLLRVDGPKLRQHGLLEKLADRPRLLLVHGRLIREPNLVKHSVRVETLQDLRSNELGTKVGDGGGTGSDSSSFANHTHTNTHTHTHTPLSHLASCKLELLHELLLITPVQDVVHQVLRLLHVLDADKVLAEARGCRGLLVGVLAVDDGGEAL